MLEQFAAFRNDFLDTLKRSCGLAVSYGQKRFDHFPIHYQTKLDERVFTIAVIGHMKRGKSTFINCILGQENDNVSPIDGLPCTSGIIAYHDKSRHPDQLECAEVQFFEGDLDALKESTRIGLSEIRKFATEAGNPGNRKNVGRIDVFADFPLLQGCVSLVDTPGKGSIYDYQDQLLAGFLPKVDAIILVISAGLPITAGERDFLDQLAEEDKKKIFYVMTKIDQVPDKKEFDKVEKWVLGQIKESGLNCRRLYPISAKQVWTQRRDPEGRTGISEFDEFSTLESDLERFIIEEADQERKLTTTFAQGIDTAREALNITEGIIGEQTALFQKSLSEILSEINELKEWIDSRKAEAKKAKKTFQKEWTRAIDNFRRRVENKADDVQDKILDMIDDRSLWDMAWISGRLQREMNKRFSSVFKEAENELEEKLQSATEKMFETAENIFDESIRDIEIKGRHRHSNTGWGHLYAAVGWSAAGVANGAGMLVGGQAVLALAGKWIALPGAYSVQALAAALGLGQGSVLYAGFIAAVAALPGALLAMAGGLAAGKIIQIIAKKTGGIQLKKDVEKAVGNALEAFFEKVDEQQKKIRSEIEKEFDSSIDEILETKQEALENAKQEENRRDPRRKAKLESDLKLIKTVSEQIKGLEMRLNRGMI